MTSSECVSCGGEVEVFHIGSAAIGGQKMSDRKQGMDAPLIEHNMRFCRKCTFAHYETNENATNILDEFYRLQPSTYGLLPKANSYLKSLAECISERVAPTGIILEIGCNDGALLYEFKSIHNREVFGIEPSSCFSDAWNRLDLRVKNAFFSSGLVPELKELHISAIVVRHVLEHIADPIGFLGNIAAIMGDQTKLVLESPYLPSVINKGRFENISYAHLNHFTIRALAEICNQLDLGIESVEEVDTDGGSFLAFLQKSVPTNELFLDRVSPDQIDDFLDRMRENGERLKRALMKFEPDEVVGYGAGAKGPFLLSLYNLGSKIKYVVDDNPSFRGQFLAGTGAEIVAPSILTRDNVKAVLVLAPTHFEKIAAALPSDKVVISVI